MSDFIIEKGIPLPVEESKEAPVVLYPFTELEIGDSFVVKGLKKTALMAAFKDCAKTHGLDWNVVVENTPDGARIWRVEPEAEESDDDEPTGPKLYVDADGVLLNDLYHRDGEIITDLPDGVYIGMPEHVYFAQKREGQSSFGKLADEDCESFWWGSDENPDVERPETDEDLLVGKGVHAVVLEGLTAYESKFAVSPYASYTSKAARQWRAAMLAKGLSPVKAKTDRNIRLMGSIVREHPEYRDKLREGLPEVTIFFTVGGIKFRARFDRLWSDGILDLKTMNRHKRATVSNRYLIERGLTRDEMTCLFIIRNMGMCLQRYLYGLARTFMRTFIENGQVYGASPKQHEWLKTLVPIDKWNFVFLFLKKVSHSSKNPSAPIVTPLLFEPGDPTDERGYRMFEAAMENYTRLKEQFGEGGYWMRVNRILTVPESIMTEILRDDEAPVEAEDDDQFDEESDDE